MIWNWTNHPILFTTSTFCCILSATPSGPVPETVRRETSRKVGGGAAARNDFISLRLTPNELQQRSSPSLRGQNSKVTAGPRRLRRRRANRAWEAPAFIEPLAVPNNKHKLMWMLIYGLSAILSPSSFPQQCKTINSKGTLKSGVCTLFIFANDKSWWWNAFFFFLLEVLYYDAKQVNI